MVTPSGIGNHELLEEMILFYQAGWKQPPEGDCMLPSQASRAGRWRGSGGTLQRPYCAVVIEDPRMAPKVRGCSWLAVLSSCISYPRLPSLPSSLFYFYSPLTPLLPLLLLSLCLVISQRCGTIHYGEHYPGGH
jgi:hypothetical protein